MFNAPRVDPEFAAQLVGGPATLKGLTGDQLPELRAGLIAAARSASLSDLVDRYDVTATGVDGTPDVTMRIHRPKGVAGALPCVFAIHGGGYLMGTFEVEDQRLDAWCRNLSAVGVSVDYRLAPETCYPGALEDCLTGLRWLFAHASEIGVDPERVGLLGTSAGGALAVATALRLRDEGSCEFPAFQLLSYPMLDDRQLTVSSQWNDVPVWDRRSNDFGWRCYLGAMHGTDQVPGYAAPGRVEDLSGLPPTLLSVGTCDVVCDETVDLAGRLYRCGVDTDLRVYAGAPHGMDRRATDSPISRTSRRDMLAWLTRQVAPRER